MPPKVKTEAERLQLRTLIIDAARNLFVQRGLDAVTMREIAKRIGYSATSIYLHFSDKESLIRAVCDTDFLALASALKNIMQISDPVERLLALSSGYAQFALTYPYHYRLMFMTEHPLRTPDQSALQKNNAEQDAYFQLKTVVEAVFNARKFRPELTDADLIAQTVWAGMHGVCALQITMADDVWIDWREITARITLMQTTLLRGLLTEANDESSDAI